MIKLELEPKASGVLFQHFSVLTTDLFRQYLLIDSHAPVSQMTLHFFFLSYLIMLLFFIKQIRIGIQTIVFSFQVIQPQSVVIRLKKSNDCNYIIQGYFLV